MISIVSPVYRAEQILPVLISEIERVMKLINQDYEIILVDDRSPDYSWKIMQKLSETNNKLRVFRLSRNFGQHAAIMAGLSKANGDWVVVMDCDMQDQPKEIIKLYNKALEGYEVVLARRAERKDTLFKRMSSKYFYKLFNYLAGIEMDREVANFGIYHKKVIYSVVSIGDAIKFFPLFVNWVGYESTSIPVEHAMREEGVSSYSFKKLLRLAFNVILSFSDKPLKLFVGFGAVMALLSLCIGFYYAIQYFLGNITEPGYSSIILSVWFLSGVLISCIGVVGIYLGKTFNQTKNRPIFIIDEDEN